MVGRFQTTSPKRSRRGRRKPLAVKHFQHLAGRPPLQKRLKDQGKPGLHFQIRVFVHPAQGIAFEARRERQGQVAAGRLVEEPRGHAGADGVELPFGQGALQPKQ